jgi:hypothetical protein
VDLHAFVADAAGGFAGVELGHGGFHRDLLPGVFDASRAHRQQPCGVELRGHVRELELDRLELADGLAELPALLRVLRRGIESATGHAQRERGDGDAAAVEYAHRVLEAFAQLADQILFGNQAVLEDQLRRVAGAQAELVLFLAGAEAGFPSRRETPRCRRACLLFVGNREHHAQSA